MLEGWKRKGAAAFVLWTSATVGWILFRREPFDPSNRLQGLWIGFLVATSMVAVALTLAALWQVSQPNLLLPKLNSPTAAAALHSLLLLQVAVNLYLYFRMEKGGALALGCAIATAICETVNIIDSVVHHLRRRRA
jgi:hypothetical protein